VTPAGQRLEGRTMLISGGSRGIGLAIGIAAAREGANVVLLAKTDTPDPRLPGTIHTAAAEIEAAGGQALAVVGDVRDEASVQGAVDRALERFGGINICVNNASALALDATEQLSAKKFDLMSQIQLRGTFLLTRAALPHLVRSPNPHVLSLSPPLNLSPTWLGAHPAYTMAKYGMTFIATAAVQNLLGGDEAVARARTPEIVADAAVEVLTRPSRDRTGQALLDVEVLREAGITDLTRYGAGDDLLLDVFVDGPGGRAAGHPALAGA
jgi:citronellol/citronellal dehydrogenase